MSADTLFKSQLKVIKNEISKNCYIIGNFNLDARMEYRDDFYNKMHLRNPLNFTLFVVLVRDGLDVW